MKKSVSGRARSLSAAALAAVAALAVLVAPVCAPLCAAKMCAPASGQEHCHDASANDTARDVFARQSTCRGLELPAVLLRSDEQVSASRDVRHSSPAVYIVSLTHGFARVRFESSTAIRLESPPDISSVLLETTVLRI